MKYADEYEKIHYEDISIYVDLDLIRSGRLEINLTSNLPFWGPTFKIKGVTVR